jgi:hypothetical protein
MDVKKIPLAVALTYHISLGNCASSSKRFGLSLGETFMELNGTRVNSTSKPNKNKYTIEWNGTVASMLMLARSEMNATKHNHDFGKSGGLRATAIVSRNKIKKFQAHFDYKDGLVHVVGDIGLRLYVPCRSNLPLSGPVGASDEFSGSILLGDQSSNHSYLKLKAKGKFYPCGDGPLNSPANTARVVWKLDVKMTSRFRTFGPLASDKFRATAMAVRPAANSFNSTTPQKLIWSGTVGASTTIPHLSSEVVSS